MSLPPCHTEQCRLPMRLPGVTPVMPGNRYWAGPLIQISLPIRVGDGINMVWLNNNKFNLDELRVAWAFCVTAGLVSYFELF